MAVLKDMAEIRKYQEQEVQLRLARGVQERSYPLAPDVPGLDIAAASHPAAETGGDYFDFIEGPNGVLYVAIGDVTARPITTVARCRAAIWSRSDAVVQGISRTAAAGAYARPRAAQFDELLLNGRRHLVHVADPRLPGMR